LVTVTMELPTASTKKAKKMPESNLARERIISLARFDLFFGATEGLSNSQLLNANQTNQQNRIMYE